jgi:2-polyprenyl-6-methoxyphenol hydroxylase-like FAD-dependent oxidoreductase
MQKISIIGSGTSGMLCAIALQQRGYDVTVYSDRSADDWLNKSAPTGTAFIYDSNIQIERNLGIDHWQDDAHHGEGVLLDFQPTHGAERLVMAGRFESSRGAAIDIRMRVHRWMNDFATDGGNIVLGAVSPEQMDSIGEESDLTLLAAGKGEISQLVPRDPERSVYDKPQRNLMMVIVEGIDKIAGDRIDFNPVKFNFWADAGEYFWVPYTHKSGKHAWCVLFEPKAGQYLDQFGEVTSADEAVEQAKAVIRQYAPYEYEFIENMQPIAGDDHCWLKGRFPPTVREACGKTASGGLVVPIGDTAITFDPIGGQGGNCAQRNTWHWVQAIVARGENTYDEAWARQTWEDFWAKHGRAAYEFNNLLLEPLTETGRTILGYAARDRVFADTAFIGNFHAPTNFFPWFVDLDAAKQKIDLFRRASQETS